MSQGQHFRADTATAAPRRVSRRGVQPEMLEAREGENHDRLADDEQAAHQGWRDPWRQQKGQAVERPDGVADNGDPDQGRGRTIASREENQSASLNSSKCRCESATSCSSPPATPQSSPNARSTTLRAPPPVRRWNWCLPATNPSPRWPSNPSSPPTPPPPRHCRPWCEGRGAEPWPYFPSFPPLTRQPAMTRRFWCGCIRGGRCRG